MLRLSLVMQSYLRVDITGFNLLFKKQVILIFRLDVSHTSKLL